MSILPQLNEGMGGTKENGGVFTSLQPPACQDLEPYLLTKYSQQGQSKRGSRYDEFRQTVLEGLFI